MKLPSIWSSEPVIWFVQAKFQFALRSIAVDETQYHHVVTAKYHATVIQIVDVVARPPPKGAKYSVLKERLLATFTLTTFLSKGPKTTPGFSSRRSSPTDLMSEMLPLVGDHSPYFLFKSIFMDHLPAEVRTNLIPVLDAVAPRELAQLAERDGLCSKFNGLRCIFAPTRIIVIFWTKSLVSFSSEIWTKSIHL